MFELKFIKNPPTVENLKSLYESEMYQNLLKKFDERSKHKFDMREWDTTAFYNRLTRYQKRYLILNVPFEEVCLEFEQSANVFWII